MLAVPVSCHQTLASVSSFCDKCVILWWQVCHSFINNFPTIKVKSLSDGNCWGVFTRIAILVNRHRVVVGMRSGGWWRGEAIGMRSGGWWRGEAIGMRRGGWGTRYRQITSDGGICLRLFIGLFPFDYWRNIFGYIIELLLHWERAQGEWFPFLVIANQFRNSCLRYSIAC